MALGEPFQYPSVLTHAELGGSECTWRILNWLIQGVKAEERSIKDGVGERAGGGGGVA